MMHHELPISLSDLKTILRSIQNSRYCISIKKNNNRLLQCASVAAFEADSALRIHYNGLEEVSTDLQVNEIKFIEFDSFFSFGARYAKRFVVA